MFLMAYWYLSFCDAERPKGQRFLGACIVTANSMGEAIKEAWLQQCNPGGEVMGHEIPPEYECNI